MNITFLHNNIFTVSTAVKWVGPKLREFTVVIVVKIGFGMETVRNMK
jgi:hypothetical protein